MMTRRRRRNRHDRGFPGAVFVAEFLRVLGVVDLILTPVGCLAILYARTDAGGAVDAPFISLLLGQLILGATLGGLLLGLAALLRYAHVLLRGIRTTDANTAEVDRPVTYAVEPESPADDGAARSDEEAATGLSQEAATKILAVLNEIRDLALVPPDEREPALQRIRTSQQQQAAAAIVDAINMRQLARARTLLAEARAVHCDATTFERLAEKINQASRRNEPLDYARNKRLVEESIAEGRWAVAERYVRDLCLDHSDSALCRQLWDDTRRARLHAHVLESASAHHWVEALAAANEFLERFPDSIEAEALRGQLDTLRENADIAQRKHYESRFKELIGGRHYGEALRLANKLIELFPESPQAGALRAQVPVLERHVAAQTAAS